ncbi:hypothetical protein SKAU_G00247500 [Synaphobranchus kaupii]|uniref:Uncharacterized protein n=1 Tax=Synaphobranchus kaupii TaxID=118154 RepID=A0A9Q1F267_SYNKA|nr:hypothetical protein SKAU_G00247500 [Synaphobranchus kaupii]
MPRRAWQGATMGPGARTATVTVALGRGLKSAAGRDSDTRATALELKLKTGGGMRAVRGGAVAELGVYEEQKRSH